MLRFTTKTIAEMAGCRLEDLSRWRDQELIGPPVWVSGHGKGGRVSLWSRRDARRVWCLTRIDGRFHDQWDVLHQLELHHAGVMYVTDAEVCCGHPEMMQQIVEGGGLDGGRLLVLDLGELGIAVAEMARDAAAE